jgi:hypothetical protein
VPKSRVNQAGASDPEELARKLADALIHERVVPRFVDSYVVEHGRHGLQVHAALYKDLLALLQREALLAASVRLLELVSVGMAGGKNREFKASRRTASLFRRKFLAALARQLDWTAGDALEFQSDLQLYEDVLAHKPGGSRARKAFEAASHPFVDRCAFLLDSSFLEKARVAASRTLTGIEEIADQVASSFRQRSEARREP